MCDQKSEGIGAFAFLVWCAASVFGDGAQFIFGEMVENGDGAADADHGQESAEADADDVASAEEAEGAGDGDVGEVEAVFREADFFVEAVGEGLHDAVTGIGHEAHVEGHGGADASAENGTEEHDNAQGHFCVGAHAAGRKVGNEAGEYVEKTGEHKAQRNLQKVQKEHDAQGWGFLAQAAQEMDGHFDDDEARVKEQGHVAEVVVEDFGHAVRDGDDRRDAESGFGVEGQSHGEDEESGAIKEESISV